MNGEDNLSGYFLHETALLLGFWKGEELNEGRSFDNRKKENR